MQKYTVLITETPTIVPNTCYRPAYRFVNSACYFDVENGAHETQILCPVFTKYVPMVQYFFFNIKVPEQFLISEPV